MEKLFYDNIMILVTEIRSIIPLVFEDASLLP